MQPTTTQQPTRPRSEPPSTPLPNNPRHSSLPRDATIGARSGKPTVLFVDLPYTGSPRSEEVATDGSMQLGARIPQNHIRWIHADSATPELLEGFEKTLGISPSVLKLLLKTEQRPKTFCYQDFVFNLLEEFSLDPQRPYTLKHHDLCLIMGSDFVISVGCSDCNGIRKVREELHGKAVRPDEVGNTNYLIARIVGATLHRNEEVINQLELNARSFSDQQSKTLPTAEDKQARVELLRSAEFAKQSTRSLADVIRTLGEESNLFGAPRPRDSLRRYLSAQQAMMDQIETIRREPQGVAKEWEALVDEQRNVLLSALTFIGGSLALYSTVFDFFGQAFSNGAPGGDAGIWTGFSLATVGSAVLLGFLIRERITRQRALASDQPPKVVVVDGNFRSVKRD